MELKSTYDYIINKIKEEGALHVSLIDPDELKQSVTTAGKMAALADKAGTDMFFVGGSTAFCQNFMPSSSHL